MTQTNDLVNEEQSDRSPHERLISLQDRISILEDQIQKIESDLPQNLSKSILYMKKEIESLNEKVNSQSDFEVPYVYSESLEKICDFQRRTEWKIKDTFQTKIYDSTLEFEENSGKDENSVEDAKSQISTEIKNELEQSIATLKSGVIQFYEDNKKNLDDLEEKLTQVKFKTKTFSNTPTTITSHIASEIEIQQKQINELERSISQMPKIINNSQRLTEKFSNYSQPKETEELTAQENDNNVEKIDDSEMTNALSNLESEVHSFSSLQFDLDSILSRVESVTQKTEENENQIMKIAEIQGKAAELLSDVEDKALSLLDKADDFTSKMSVNSNSAPLEEMEKDTRNQLREFKREIAAFKEAISKREAQIARSSS